VQPFEFADNVLVAVTIFESNANSVTYFHPQPDAVCNSNRNINSNTNAKCDAKREPDTVANSVFYGYAVSFAVRVFNADPDGISNTDAIGYA
jgi:hypothetical protein